MYEGRYKYPRTPHLPWSPGADDDDVVLDIVSFEDREVIVSEKLDGENTTMYRDHIHARSIDSRHHPSRDWVKRLHGRVAHQIPARWRFCGENVYARHSIPYDELESYFYLFSIWNGENECLSWDETLEWAALLSLETPPILYRGIWDEALVRGLELDVATQEGYVVRTAAPFQFQAFQQHIAKWVRPNHVQTTEHWMHQPVVPNGLKDD